MYPAIDHSVIEFINFARCERQPVTSNHIEPCAEQAAKRCKIQSFCASNGCLLKFLHRSPVQSSFKLHRKARSSLPVRNPDRIIEIREGLSQHDPKNIYSKDESALYYRLGPSRSYLAANEIRQDARGTEFQKHKRRISIVMCVNYDGSHIFSVSYNGTATNPHCFNDPRFTSLKEKYYAQPNKWIQSNGFWRWINFWYSELKKISSVPWCLLMDSFR